VRRRRARVNEKQETAGVDRQAGAPFAGPTPTRSRSRPRLTDHRFDYLGHLRSAHQDGAHFVVGDARGCDRLAQETLASMAATVTVFHMFD
jgi:hypothetical protein